MSDRRWQQVEDQEWAGFADDPQAWLAGHMSEGMPWLLVHADDGVIWGRRGDDGGLRLSGASADIAAKYPSIHVELRAATLQQGRIFGPAGELLVWRDGAGLRGRRIMDGEALPEDAWQEWHMLWGTRVMQAEGFTVLQEGQRGPVHAVPLLLSGGRHAALTVRHYVERNELGQAVVSISRLAGLGPYDGQGGR